MASGSAFVETRMMRNGETGPCRDREGRALDGVHGLYSPATI